jgi:hypothetical protein
LSGRRCTFCISSLFLLLEPFLFQFLELWHDIAPVPRWNLRIADLLDDFPKIRTAEDRSDPRYSTPGIKNASSIRQIPVSKPTALLVQEYVMNYRGKQDHSFLISSRNRRPFSAEGVTKIFQKITASLSKNLQTLLMDMTGEESISAHPSKLSFHTGEAIFEDRPSVSQWLIRLANPSKKKAHSSRWRFSETSRRGSNKSQRTAQSLEAILTQFEFVFCLLEDQG